jgi:hypothetical protein
VAVEGKNAAHLIGHITKHKALLFPFLSSSIHASGDPKVGIRSGKKERMKKKKHRKSDQPTTTRSYKRQKSIGEKNRSFRARDFFLHPIAI